jgi:L-lactate dehydrogenase complex protein LldG
MSARDEVLARLRTALAPSRADHAVAVPDKALDTRANETPQAQDRREVLELLVDRLTDYKAVVTRCTADGIASTVADVLDRVTRLVVPHDIPREWLSGYPGTVITDGAGRIATLADLDGAGAVLTGCALAIAETGTIVLDAGSGQGRRALTLVPDFHLCVVHSGQIVKGVPDGIGRLDPVRPLTFISGPSATSDIELNRVEGVHGPRRLHVLLVAEET